jgi:hypothetical protein
VSVRPVEVALQEQERDLDVTGTKDAEEARAYYAEEFLSARHKRPTPYMERLRFQPGTGTADPDQRVLSDQDLEHAVEEGKQKDQANA